MPRNDEHKGTSNRGFASMDQAKQREIASKGGQSVPPEKRSFSQDPQLAAQAGRKGGESVPPEGRSFSQNRELAAEAGRKGGQSRGAAARALQQSRGGDAIGTQQPEPKTRDPGQKSSPSRAAKMGEKNRPDIKDGPDSSDTSRGDQEELQAQDMNDTGDREDSGFNQPNKAGHKSGPHWHGTR